MKLELHNVNISNIILSDKNNFSDGSLTIDKNKLIQSLKDMNEFITNVELNVVKPGDNVRIIPVKDVIEPRLKLDGKGDIFPGFFGNNEIVGDGKTLVLKGSAVITTGNIVGFQEGIIDMSGPGALYTPYSKTINLVVKCDVDTKVDTHQREKIVRLVGLHASKLVADIAKDAKADNIESFEHKPFTHNINNLPRVAYIYMLQSQGLLHDTYVYGVDAKQILPTIISPTEIMDGAIVSGNCVSACDKVQTYIHQNNPVIHELLKRHGKDYNFVGAIITNENVTLKDKETSSNWTTKLAKMLDIDAAIISEEGFGNPDADLVMNCNNLENAGIKTVLLTDEYAGQFGEGQSLADVTPKGDACITNGNANQIIHLPKMDTVIGYLDEVNIIAGGFDGSLHSDGSLTVEIQAIIGATNEMGFHNLSSKGF